MAEIEVTPAGPPGLIARFRRAVRSVYLRLARWQPVIKLVIVFLVLQLLANVAFSLYVLIAHKTIAFHEWGETVSSLVSGLFVIGGMWYIRYARYMAYRFFRISILISIFLTEFFVFYETPYLALLALLVNIFMLAVLNYVIHVEKHHVVE